ncbi:MAG: TIGR03546 family protein [Bacillota bacterium]
MFWIKTLRSILSILQSEISPRQIAGGFAMGAVIGLVPSPFLKILFFLLVLVLKINIGAALLSVPFFTLAGLATDLPAHWIGHTVLVRAGFLSGLWTFLYNIPVVPYTGFNNTVVMGNFILSLILFPPVYFGAIRFVLYYRARLRQKVEKWKIMKWFKLANVFNIYGRYAE